MKKQHSTQTTAFRIITTAFTVNKKTKFNSNFSDREAIASGMRKMLDIATEPWGIKVCFEFVLGESRFILLAPSGALIAIPTYY